MTDASEGYDTDIFSESEESEEYNSEEEEKARKAHKRKKERELRKKLGLKSGYRQREDGRWHYHVPELPPPPKKWRMNNFTNSEASPLLNEILFSPTLLRDLFVKPRLLNTMDLSALGCTCTAFTPLLCAKKTKIREGDKGSGRGRSRRRRAPLRGEDGEEEEEEEEDGDTALTRIFETGGEEIGEHSMTVDFDRTRLAFPTRWVAGLALPRGQAVTCLTLLNLSSELTFELGGVITAMGLPNLTHLALSAPKAPLKMLNSKKGGLLPILFHAPHAQLPQLKSLSLVDMKVSAATWKRLQTVLRRSLSPALKRKRFLVLEPEKAAAAAAAATAAATTSSTSSKAAGSGKGKGKGAKTTKGKATGAAAGSKKKPRASAAAEAKKKGPAAAKGKGKGKGKKPQPPKAPQPAQAPSPLVRCAELRFASVGKLPKGLLLEILLSREQFSSPLAALVLDDTHAGEKELGYLVQAIEEGAHPTLTELGIREDNLTDAMAAVMVNGLAAHCSAVKLLALATSGTHTPAPLLVKSLVAAAKGTGEGGSGPGLASSLKRLGISWPGLTNSDRDVLIPAMLNVDTTGGGAGGSQALAFPVLSKLALFDMDALGPHVLAILKAVLRRRITDLDLSFCGGNKQAVIQMVAEVKRTIPTLGLPKTQPVKMKLIQFKTQRYGYYYGYGYYNNNNNNNDRRFSWQEMNDLRRGLNEKWSVVYTDDRYY